MSNQKRERKRGIRGILILLFAVVFVISAAGLFKTLWQADRENEAFEGLASLVGPGGAGDEETGSDSDLSDLNGLNGLNSGAVSVRDPEAPVSVTDYLNRDFSAVAEKNADFAAWLAIPGTRVDYPVMMTPDDPQYYIRRDFYGESSVSGCLFLGEGCTADSGSMIIYGHNMKNGSMFGSLDNYKDGEFGKSHPYLVFSTLDGDRVYEIFAAFQTRIYKEGENGFRYYQYTGDLTEEQFDEFVSQAKRISSYDTGVTPEYGEQLIMLSTCSYHTEDGRFVVAARRIE